MTWSYSGDPDESPLDEARFLLGDTDEEDPLITNEEINYTLKHNKVTYTACAVCCDTLARKYSREIASQMGSGSLQVQAQQRAEAFTKRAAELRAMVISKVPAYSVGSDPSVDRPATFKRGMMENHNG